MMSLRGSRMPARLENRPIPASGLLRHGPYLDPSPPVQYPPVHPPPVHRHLLEPSLPPELEILERRISVQSAKMEKLARENQRLASSHVSMRQDIVQAQKELEMIQEQQSGSQKEMDLQITGAMERVRAMEGQIQAGAMVQRELQHAHIEAQGLLANQAELSAEVRRVAEEQEKTTMESKVHEMCAELDGLRQEHQKLRAAFEYEKGSNIKQVEEMRAMERNLLSMSREIERLRSDISNTEKRLQAETNPYSGVNQNQNYHNQNPAVYHQPVVPEQNQSLHYQQQMAQATAAAAAAATTTGYTQGYVYGHGFGYTVPGYVHASHAAYPVSGAYAPAQHPVSGVTTTDGTNLFSAMSMYQAVVNNPYGVTHVNSYDPASGSSDSTQKQS